MSFTLPSIDVNDLNKYNQPNKISIGQPPIGYWLPL